jgi:hypothetical protein
MTALRWSALGLAYLAGTVVLVGLCGVPGLLTWLGIHTVGLCMPKRAADAVTSLRWRHVAAAWQWLDRR